MKEVVIRAARGEDRESLGKLKLQASLAWGDHIDELLALPEARDVPAARLPHTFIAERDGKIVGFATVLLRNDRTQAELEGLFVAPELWRGGLGRLLIAEAERRAASHGARSLHVVAGDHARPFYEAAGYRFSRMVMTDLEPAAELKKDLR